MSLKGSPMLVGKPVSFWIGEASVEQAKVARSTVEVTKCMME